MFSLKGKRVLIFQQRGWAINIGHYLAKMLQKEGVVLAAFTTKQTTDDFIRNQREVVYEKIVSTDDATDNPKAVLAGDKITLKEICENLEIDSVWPFVYSERNHTRSYQDKYYYAYKQNVSDEGIIDYVGAVYKYVFKMFDEFKPDIIITPNFVALQHLISYFIAKKRGIPMVALMDSKINANYIFMYDYNYASGSFHNRVDELNAGKAKSSNAEKAKKYIEEFRKKFKVPEGAEYNSFGNKKRTLWQKIRNMLSPYYHIYKWYTTKQINHWRSVGPTIDYRPPKIILRDHYAFRRYIKFSNNFKYYPFEKIGKCAYFPLQVQPEATIDVIAPFFNNQIEAARLVAMSLPDDYTLVVKEHPAMIGKRPPSYFEKLNRTPNIKLIDYRIPSQKVMEKASLIVSPSGTTVAEAAFLNKPVIQLGNLGTTEKLPNVWKHTDMPALPKKIKEVLSANLKTDDYERKLLNYVSAAYDCGIEANYLNMWERGKEVDKMDKLWNFYKTEIEKLLNN
ncbi:MAG: hypothetical protein WCT19_03205 [Candidatus Paceibacterota bacterium]